MAFCLLLSAGGYVALRISPFLMRASLFSDSPAGDPVTTAAEFLAGQNILSGYPDGTFRAGNPVNRAELTKIIVGLARRQGAVQECALALHGALFTDVTPTDWFAPFVCSAKEHGIIQGYADGSFRPANTVTFAEAAKMIAGALEYELDAGDPWYKPAVELLSARHAIPVSIQSFDAELRRGELAQILHRLLAGITGQPSQTWDDLVAQHAAATMPAGLLLHRINGERSHAGLSALHLDAQLQQTAQAHAEDMQARHYYSHVSPEGADVSARVRASGYLSCNCPFQIGENIVAAMSPEEAIAIWMGSPAHLANLLSDTFQDIGIGHAGSYWVATFGYRAL